MSDEIEISSLPCKEFEVRMFTELRRSWMNTVRVLTELKKYNQLELKVTMTINENIE